MSPQFRIVGGKFPLPVEQEDSSKSRHHFSLKVDIGKKCIATFLSSITFNLVNLGFFSLNKNLRMTTT